MKREPLLLLHLYPRDMNIYGDMGNLLTLKRRAQWHGYDVKVMNYNPGDAFPKKVDLIVGGGGQDSGQDTIQQDLLSIGGSLHRLAGNDVPMLMICGLYQLFGKFFKTQDGHTIDGIGVFDATTLAGPERLTGNIIIESPGFGQVIGYENHSGQTFLGNGLEPLGQVIRGAGNNGQDGTEGARYKNVIGSYLHGSLLPKNPVVADFLIEQAAINKYGDFTATVIDDNFATEARQVAAKRPR